MSAVCTQVDDLCPYLHYQAETKLLQCYVLRDADHNVDLPAQLNYNKKLQSYARAMYTGDYEACLVSK